MRSLRRQSGGAGLRFAWDSETRAQAVEKTKDHSFYTIDQETSERHSEDPRSAWQIRKSGLVGFCQARRIHGNNVEAPAAVRSVAGQTLPSESTRRVTWGKMEAEEEKATSPR